MRQVLTAKKELCIGCRTCELFCALNKTGQINPYRARIRVKTVSDLGSFAPIICRHCAKPACLYACKVPGAMVRDERTGVVAIVAEKCTKCGECVKACVFNAIQVDAEGNPLKCDMCGGDPVCVRYCPKRPADSLPHLHHPEQACLEFKELHKADSDETADPENASNSRSGVQ
jgi:carbon-monoxide dehydrogenase iron sulfur subunit